MKQLFLSLLTLTVAILFWHCTAQETSGTASGADNAIAGVVYNPDTTFAAGVTIVLRQGNSLPEENQVDESTTTNAQGAFSFNNTVSNGIIVIQNEYQSQIVAQRLAVTAGDQDLTILLQPTESIPFVVPEHIDTAQVWVAGDSSSVTAVAGDTLHFTTIPLGIHTIYIQENNTLSTDSVGSIHSSITHSIHESSSSTSNNILSSSAMYSSTVSISSATQSGDVQTSSTEIIPHPIDSTNPIQFRLYDTLDMAVNNPPQPITATLLKEDERFDHIVWEPLDTAVFRLQGDTIVHHSYGIGRLRALDTVEWREGILYVRVEKYLDTRLNSHGGVTTYESVEIDDMRIMKTNMNVAIETESSCYEESLAQCSLYGRLYNWDRAKESCPEGWRIPWNSEWRHIGEYITAQESLNRAFSDIWLVGPHMMDTLKLWWNDQGDTIDVPGDRFGFSAFPAGKYDATTMSYSDLHRSATFWGIDDDDPENRTTIAWSLQSDSQNFTRSAIQSPRSYNAETGETIIETFPDISQNRYSVRCILDQ